jgi:hypothetical protein
VKIRPQPGRGSAFAVFHSFSRSYRQDGQAGGPRGKWRDMGESIKEIRIY